MVLQYNFGKYLNILIGVSMAVLVLIGASSIYGMEKSREGLNSLFFDDMVPVEKLEKIKFLMMENRVQLRTALSEVELVETANKDVSIALNHAEAVKATEAIEKNIDSISSLWQAYMATNLSPEEVILADNFAKASETYMDQGLKPALTALRDNNYQVTKKYTVATRGLFSEAVVNMNLLTKNQFDAAQAETKAGTSRFKTMIILFLVLQLGALASVIFIGRFLTRSYTESMKQVLDVFKAMSRGKFDSVINAQGKDEFSQLLQALDSCQTSIKRFTEDTQLLKLALNKVSLGLMITDNDRNIMYVNNRSVELLKTMEVEIKQQLPQFSVDKLIGMNIDLFHKDASHQARLLASLTQSFTGDFKLGNKDNRIVAAPLVNERGTRLGTVAEWHDRTVVVAAEQEMTAMIASVINGDFSKRIRLADKTGFYKEAGKGMNSIVDIFDAWMKEIIRVLASIERGDLTEKIEDSGEDAGIFSQLVHHANATVDNLHDLIVQITMAADAINTASREVAEGNTDLSQRTEEQAASLEQTASSMEQLASTVKNNAENAKQARQMAAVASSVATKGSTVVGQVVQTMVSINDSSLKIVDIISVIDTIAFQTNILALNAAVEAARAGEQGRGFAVVASEVRALAHKSAEAAKEIKLLISDSVRKVEGGSKLVDEAGSTMEEIFASVKQVTDRMDEISAASAEQSSGIDQVNQAVMQMDEVTQQNASLVEQSAAAATSMQEQAHALMEAVGVFKLSNTMPKKPEIVRQLKTVKTAKTAKTAKANSVPASRKLAMVSSSSEWEEF